MNMTIPRIANGFIGLSMLAMLAVAIVAGQVRAKPGAELQPVTEVQPHASVVLQLQNIKGIEALPAIADTLLDLPFEIEIDVEAGLITATRRSPLEGHE
jgi:hypothetical protein